jgi:hypothetical protein
MRDRIGRWARAVGWGAVGALLGAGLVATADAASVEIPGRRAAPGVSAPRAQGGSVQADSRRGGAGWSGHDDRRGHGGGGHRPSHWGHHAPHWNHHHHHHGGWGWGHWRPAPVWVPGSWIWGGWGWVWQPGYWR